MTATTQTACSRPVTGRMVLICLIAFFAVISLANGIMIRAALTTFGGVETGSAYQAGQTFKNEVAAARAQEARHWQVKVTLHRTDSQTLIEIEAVDASGRQLAGLEATASLHHPTDARADQSVAMTEDTSGHFRGSAGTALGQRDLLVEFTRDGERMFRSRNRIVLQ